jgi:hypothetical protein
MNLKTIFNKLNRLFYSLVICALLLVAFVNSVYAQATQMPTGRFTFDVIPETFLIGINYKGVYEQANSALPAMQVADLVKSDSLVSWSIPARHISVLIQKRNDYLDVTIKANDKGKFTWPKVAAGSYMLPLWEGKYIPAKDTLWKAFLKGPASGFMESFSMGFFALNKPRYAIVYVVKNTFNNEVTFGTDPDINFSIAHEFTSVNKEKTYGFRIYVTDNDPVAISAVYKNYIIETGRFKGLKEKAAENPNIRKLYGAPQIYFWTSGIISAKNIRWPYFYASLKANKKLFEWLPKVVKICGEEELATEFNEVLAQLNKQPVVNAYQKKVILKVFNTSLSAKELYNPTVFMQAGKVPVPNLLSEQQLYVLNKRLLKGALKNVIDEPKEWGKESIATLDDMYRSGIRRAWIGFSDWADGLMNPALVKKANELGYLIGPYDAYHSIQKDEDRSWRTNWFPDSSLYNNATITNSSGKKPGGFLGRGRQLNPTLAFAMVKQRVANILSDHIGYNSWFVDCDAFGEVFEDYTPQHPTTQQQDAEARKSRMEYIGKDVKMVVGSEQGNDYTSCSLAFAQGMEMPVFKWVDPDFRDNKDSPYYLGGYYIPSGCIPPIYLQAVPLKPLYKHVYIDPAYSLPLFRLVYNNSVITTAHWESGSLKIKGEAGTRMLSELLYNTPPLYHLDPVTWKLQKKLIARHVKFWSAVHQKAVQLPMTGFNILTDDKMVQQTVFGNKLWITVNFSSKAVRVGKQLIMGRSAVVKDGGETLVYSVENVTQ